MTPAFVCSVMFEASDQVMLLSAKGFPRLMACMRGLPFGHISGIVFRAFFSVFFGLTTVSHSLWPTYLRVLLIFTAQKRLDFSCAFARISSFPLYSSNFHPTFAEIMATSA
jgi:hypothetical protein